MQFPREYVAYMAKQVLKRLTKAGLIQYDQPEYVTEVMYEVMLDEFSIEDRINDEVRRILEAAWRPDEGTGRHLRRGV